MDRTCTNRVRRWWGLGEEKRKASFWDNEPLVPRRWGESGTPAAAVDEPMCLMMNLCSPCNLDPSSLNLNFNKEKEGMGGRLRRWINEFYGRFNLFVLGVMLPLWNYTNVKPKTNFSNQGIWHASHTSLRHLSSSNHSNINTAQLITLTSMFWVEISNTKPNCFYWIR